MRSANEVQQENFVDVKKLLNEAKEQHFQKNILKAIDKLNNAKELISKNSLLDTGESDMRFLTK